MKKTITFLKSRRPFAICCIVLLCVSLLAGCGRTKDIDGVVYDTYGLFDKDEKKNPDIQYELIWGNIIWGAILCETIVAPIYFYGFSMWEPVGKKNWSYWRSNTALMHNTLDNRVAYELSTTTTLNHSGSLFCYEGFSCFFIEN